MASKIKIEELYQIYKAMGLKRICSQEMADMAGVSRQTLYKWREKYKWEERYLAETSEQREAFETEIRNRMQNGDLLIDVIRDDMLMKFAITVKSDKYQPTLDDITKICELSIKNKNIKDIANNDDKPQKAHLSITFDDSETDGDSNE